MRSSPTPKGVTVETKDLTPPADKDSRKVTIEAATAVVDHAVQVAAEAAVMPKVASDFRLTVNLK